MNKPARRRSSYKNIEDEQSQQQQQQSQTDATPSSSATNSDSRNNGNGNGNAMDGAHRKIELQSPEDLTFLITNVRRAAEEHINAAFPPVDDTQDDGADELRVRIEKLVVDVCFFFFLSSHPSIGLLWLPLFPSIVNESRNERGADRTGPTVHLADLHPRGAKPLHKRLRPRRQDLPSRLPRLAVPIVIT
jgi:hypothetical protein